MPRLHVQSEIHRSISRDQPQRRRAPSWYFKPNQAKAAAVFSRRREGIVPCPLVQIPRRGPSEYESPPNVHVDLRQRRFQIQKLWEFTRSVSDGEWRPCFCVTAIDNFACVENICGEILAGYFLLSWNFLISLYVIFACNS